MVCFQSTLLSTQQLKAELGHLILGRKRLESYMLKAIHQIAMKTYSPRTTLRH